MKGLVDQQKGDREKNILQVLRSQGEKKKKKETSEMVLQDNQDIALTDEDKQRLVQSDLQPGQVKENQIHLFHFSKQK